MPPCLGYYTAIYCDYYMLVDLTPPGSGKMVALEQRHDRQVLSDRAEIIIEPSHSCKLHFVRYQEPSHVLHICVTSRVHV